jgi:hypothetical protein
MNNLDYYAVIESRIKYFEKKYDPHGKLARKAELTPLEVPVGIKNKPLRKRVNTAINSVISFLF